MKSRTAADTTRAFKRMTTKTFPEKFGLTKEQKLKESLNNFVIQKRLSFPTHTVKQTLPLPSEIFDHLKT